MSTYVSLSKSIGLFLGRILRTFGNDVASGASRVGDGAIAAVDLNLSILRQGLTNADY